MDLVIGGYGLTGSAICRALAARGRPYDVIGRAEAGIAAGRRCETLIYANGNAVKWRANEDPSFDFQASVASAAHYVHGVSCSSFVLISTVDVYSDKASEGGTHEEALVDPLSLDAYGFHKRLVEDYVRRFHSDHLIVRLPALVGPGLAKNPIYDMLHPEKEVLISPESRLNVIHTDRAAEILLRLLERGVRGTYNLAARDSLRLGDVPGWTGARTRWSREAEQRVQTYSISTAKLGALVNLPSSRDAVERYVSLLDARRRAGNRRAAPTPGPHPGKGA